MSDTYEPNKGVAYHRVLCTSVIEHQSLNLTGLIVHRDPDFVLCHMPFRKHLYLQVLFVFKSVKGKETGEQVQKSYN